MSRYIVAVDQSTSASKAFLLDETGTIVKRFVKPHQQFYPQPGRVEHDAQAIWDNVREGIAALCQGITPGSIGAIAIANQRETTVLWDRASGLPVCRAVVWQDVRGEGLCKTLHAQGDTVQNLCGLPLSPYFPAAKAASVMQASPDLAARAKAGSLCIGTMESYLIYRLTGGKVFGTDVSNASRTQLMNLVNLQWDRGLCDLFGIPLACLPQILPSDGDFGCTCGHIEGVPQGLPITGVMGDSHASLFGQGCLQAGMAKATYGTGSSVMMNVGESALLSQNGLSASVGFGFRGQTCYVLEGNVTCSGDTLCWLRDELGLIGDVGEAASLAATVADTQGVYMVPAFSGLGAPYFDGNARALLYGMNRGTTKAHIVRAALESIAFQDRDVIAAMEKDLGQKLAELRADGGPSGNQLLMQFQADLLGCPVRTAAQSELSALGAGYMGGMATGVYGGSLDSIPAAQGAGAVYQPGISANRRQAFLAGWQDAVSRCRT